MLCRGNKILVFLYRLSALLARECEYRKFIGQHMDANSGRIINQIYKDILIHKYKIELNDYIIGYYKFIIFQPHKFLGAFTINKPMAEYRINPIGYQRSWYG
jgi:hypothetical protein